MRLRTLIVLALVWLALPVAAGAQQPDSHAEPATMSEALIWIAVIFVGLLAAVIATIRRGESVPWWILWNPGASRARKGVRLLFLIVWLVMLVWLGDNPQYLVGTLFGGGIIYFGLLGES